MSRALHRLAALIDRRRDWRKPAREEHRAESTQPVLFVVPDVLSAEECQVLVDEARRQGRLARAAAIAAGLIVPKPRAVRTIDDSEGTP